MFKKSRARKLKISPIQRALEEQMNTDMKSVAEPIAQLEGKGNATESEHHRGNNMYVVFTYQIDGWF